MNLADLFSERTNQAISHAAKLSGQHGQRFIDTEYLLLGVLQDEIVVGKILSELKLEKSTISQSVEKVLPNALTQTTAGGLTPRAAQVIQLAYQEAINLEHNYIGTEHLLLGLILEDEGIAAQILKRNGATYEKLKDATVKIVGSGNESGKAQSDSATPTLDQFSKDLTELAKQNKIDPVIGRSDEITRVIEILSRRKKNNPVLIGEPGVGKTAIAEGLALRIASGLVPEVLQNKKVKSLDLGLLIAGAKFRGEFEERAKKLLSELESSNKEIILFIDEIHTIVGSGAQQGELDLSNMLKPALARGEMQLIGATTLNEYQKYIEKDAALERRFQPVLVNEPTVDQTILILQGIKERYEAHHKLTIQNEALTAAAKLADRYIKDRFMPDKAIDVLDEAASRVRLKFTSEPDALIELKAEIKKLEAEREALTRAGQYPEAAEIKVKQEQIREKLSPLEEELARTRGTGTPEVSTADIQDVVSRMTGVKITDLDEDEKEKLANLAQSLHQRVIGQEEAVKLVSDAVRRARVGLKDPKRPIANFLFLGPTGVGKTELAKALAQNIFGDESAIIRIDMSEYMDKFTVNRLIGSPPGYVGYEEGGQLTEAVRRKPYSIILLDEFEKAHPDVANILLQVMEDGRLTDGKGRTVDFKNTILIATSNLGSDILIAKLKEEKDKELQKLKAESAKQPETKLIKTKNKPAENTFENTYSEVLELLKRQLRPELLNRFDEIVMFKPLSRMQMAGIVKLLLNNTKELLQAQNIGLVIEDTVINALAESSYDPEFGARPARRYIQKNIENELTNLLISGAFVAGDTVQIGYSQEKFTFTKLNLTASLESA